MDLNAGVVGQVLNDVPLGTMLENLGVAIATAQERLDGVAIETALRLANTKVSLYDADGRAITRSLLELGFSPTFYQFTEATIEVSFAVSMKVEEKLAVEFGFRLGAAFGNQELDPNLGGGDDGSEEGDDDDNDDDDDDDDDDDKDDDRDKL
jgi:hypothetical protein